MKSLLLVLLAFVCFACGASSGETTPIAPARAALHRSRLVTTLTATWQPNKQALIFQEKRRTESQDPITISQSGGGVCGPAGQPCDTVDLVSTNCATHGGVFQCDVELRSFFTSRSLPNVYAQITSVTYQGQPISGYDAINSDTDSVYSPPLSSTHGLWSYSNGAAFGSGPSTFLSPNDGSNGGNGVACAQGGSGACSAATRTWEFGNPSNLAITYEIAVWASLSWGSYGITFGPGVYTPVCPAAGGSGTFQSAISKTNIPLPFDFTVYEATYNGAHQEVSVARNGQLTFGSTSLTASGTAIALPSTSVPSPSVFAFWDNLVAGSTIGSGICTETTGTAPNRTFLVEWYGMDFASPPGSPSDSSAFLDFEAALCEGTGEIDLTYQTMTPSSTEATAGRESGALATVGIQGKSGSVATADYHDSSGFGYGTGSSWALVPSP